MKFFQFSATLTIIDAVRHCSKKKFYQALTGLLVCSINSNKVQVQQQIGHTKQKNMIKYYYLGQSESFLKINSFLQFQRSRESVKK